MDARFGYEAAHRHSSLPSSPTSIDGCAALSFDDMKSSPRRRSTSLSRVRDSFRRRSTNIQHRFERKVLQMCELHLDSPLPVEGPRGLVFHVPDLPGDHTRESVSEVLHQSISWLRENPIHGKSPFLPTNCSKLNAGPDLLDVEVEAINVPLLQPVVSHAPLADSSITTIEFCHEEAEDIEKFAPVECLPAPTLFGVLIDLNAQSGPQPSSRPEVTQAKYDYLPYRAHVHPNLTPLISRFQPPLLGPPPPPLPVSCRPSELRIQKSTVTAELTNRETRQQQTQSQISSTTPSSSSVLHQQQSVVSSIPSSSKTPPTSTPPRFLGVGLRPIPAPLLIVTPAPSTTKPSIDFTHQDDTARCPQTSETAPRKLSRKGNNRDLRARGIFEIKNNPSPPGLVPEYVAYPGEAARHTSVAERINRLNKNLPGLPSNESVVFTRTNSKTRKRLGVYGRPSQTKNVEASDISTTKTETKDRPFGEFRPYTGTPTPPPYESDQSPFLLPIPHPRRASSVLKEIRDEPLPDSGYSQSVPPSITRLPAYEHKAWSNKDTKAAHASSPSYPAETLQVSSQPYSQTVVRKGTLSQLGGRVIRICNHFEESINAMPSTPSKNNNKLDSSGPLTNLQSTNSHSSSPTAFYNHKNNHIDRSPSSPSVCLSPTRRSTSLSTKATANASRAQPETYGQSRYPLYHPPSPVDQSLYGLLHPDQAKSINSNPDSYRDSMSQATQRRLLAAADESDLGAAWKRTVETGRESELMRKLDYSVWEWKRFGDSDWNKKDREKLKPKDNGKRKEQDRQT